MGDMKILSQEGKVGLRFHHSPLLFETPELKMDKDKALKRKTRN